MLFYNSQQSSVLRRRVSSLTDSYGMTQKDSHAVSISFPYGLFSINKLLIKLGLIDNSYQLSVLRRFLQNDIK